MMGNTSSRFVLEIARRWGKTWLLCCIAIEVCLRNPKGRVVYGAPTLKHLEEFIIPTIEAICESAPEDCRPTFDRTRGHFNFPNGAYIHLFGADDKRKANRGRGPEALAAFFDECGFTSILRYVLKSVFRPQLLHTGGRTFLGSTPAEEPEHDFTAIAEREEVNGNYANRTIYDNPRLTKEQVTRFIEDDAKEEGLSVEAYLQSDDFRREYMAERVVNKLLIVLPEWETQRDKLIMDIPRPEFFNGTTVLDFGGNDPHAAMFGYWHFQRAAWVIEDEVLLRDGQNTQQLSEAIKAKERQLWGVNQWDGTLRGAAENPEEALLANLPEWMADVITKEAPQQPFSRWADNNLALVRDLYDLHGMVFIPTSKDNKELQVNNLRVMVNASQVFVNPRAVHTDRHWRTTTWANHKRKDYARRAGEHGDLLDTGVYGARNLDKRNPFPKHWGALSNISARREDIRRPPDRAVAEAFLGSNTQLARRLLNRGKRR